MATYLSGDESIYGVSPKLKWKDIIEDFHMDSTSSTSYMLDSVWLYNRPQDMYLVSTLLLYTYNQKVGDKIFYRTVFERLSTYTQKEILDFFTTELEIKKLSEFILSMKPDIWETISQKRKSGS